MELYELTALELGERIKKREVSAVEATRTALARVRALEPDHNAFLTVVEERALSQAADIQKRLDSGEDLGPLAGVPMALKDNICTRGIRTTCASRILGDFIPPYDATLVRRLEAGGGILLGKLNMDEFAMGTTSETSCYGPVRNPWSRERVPGGSSGGPAAAVAARACWYAVGSDTGGSIRQPAAFCGVTGMKPSYGAVSRYGLIAYASSLDQMGPIARTAADCAAVLDQTVGRDRRDSTSLGGPGNLLSSLTGDIRGMRVGLPVEGLGEGLNGAVRAAVSSVAEVLRARGASVEACSLPAVRYGVPAYYIIASAEASSNLARFDGVRYGYRAGAGGGLRELYVESRTEGFGAEVKRRILLGTFVLSAGHYEAYYQKALRARAVIAEAYRRAFEQYDLLLTPVAPATAPRLGECLEEPLKRYLSDVYTAPVNLAGLPGISVPCGFDPEGLPIGAQLIGPPQGDRMVLNAAHAYQLETDYHTKRPGGGEKA